MSLNISNIVVGPLETNCYILNCDITNEAILIDPGENGDKILKCIKSNNYSVKGIVLTHSHYDHVGALEELRNILKVPVMAHSDGIQIAGFIGVKDISHDLKDGERIDIGKSSIKVIYTPGHSPGSICLYGEDIPPHQLLKAHHNWCGGILVSGDTLFRNGVGRADLPGGSWKSLQDSIQKKLFVLPDETKVYPGHGPSTTIKEEKNN